MHLPQQTSGSPVYVTEHRPYDRSPSHANLKVIQISTQSVPNYKLTYLC
jgi:hypothetical protein